jgi:hypothetical protein
MFGLLLIGFSNPGAVSKNRYLLLIQNFIFFFKRIKKKKIFFDSQGRKWSFETAPFRMVISGGLASGNKPTSSPTAL